MIGCDVMTKNKLSIYLTKEGTTKFDDIFEENIDVLNKYSDDKVAYFIRSTIHPPKWLNSFFGISQQDLTQSNSRVVLLVRRQFGEKNRIFAVTFGYAKSLFKEDVLEEQFGLRVLLNCVEEDELRKISKINIGGNQKQSQEQIPRSGKISEFGFDIDRDLVRNVTASTSIDEFERGVITGGDIFSVTVERTVDNIEQFLDVCYNKYLNISYKERFDWVDNVREVKSQGLISHLDSVVVEFINNHQYESVWMAVPDIIDWVDLAFFKYTGSHEEFDDIYIEKFILLFENERISDVEQLKSKKIRAISATDGHDIAKWSAYKCIIAEIEYNKISYCINNGRWYKIDKIFADRVNSEYNTIPLSNLSCIPYFPNGNPNYSENNYNEELSLSINNSKLIHKIGEIPYGGGQGNVIEVCDILTETRELLHIKKNTGSAPLSHLFNQAVVSAEALLDSGFREKWNNKLNSFGWNDCIDANFDPTRYTIVIGIINKYNDERPRIPFFSRVSIRFASKTIRNMGYNICLKNICKQ